MKTPKLKSVAVLIGYDSNRACVYSEVLDLSAYYDTEHVWDKAASIKRLKLRTIKGFLFASNGVLDQEFETHFDAASGARIGGCTRYADGTFNEDGVRS